MAEIKDFSIIVAASSNRGIGFDGKLPWPYLSGDMKHFRELTTKTRDPTKQNAVIMGRLTYESIGQLLPNRVNVILSKVGYAEDAHCYDDLTKALTALTNMEKVESIFVIGGGQIYAEAIKHPRCSKIYYTYVDIEVVCDTYFPEITKDYEMIKLGLEIVENNATYRFIEYVRR